MIAPLLAQLSKSFQLDLKIIHQLIVVFLGGINLRVGRWLDGCLSFFPVVDRLSVCSNLALSGDFLRTGLLQHRVLLKFLVNHGAQVEQGRLQHRQRLLHLGGHRLDLRHPLSQLHSLFERHVRSDNGYPIK